jgi:hypothetical protein
MRVLGGDAVAQIRNSGARDTKNGDIDVEVLLDGAEKLCGVYPIAGAREKIATLRARHEKLATSITRYEALVSKQASQLDRLNKPKDYDEPDGIDFYESKGTPKITAKDLRKEEEELRELEEKKRGLEDRVSGMEKDLGGLMR